MNYATIKKHDVANGPGVRVSLFVSGCTHHCKGCFNQETWDKAKYKIGNNEELILLYLDIGKFLYDLQQNSKYGDKITTKAAKFYEK